MQFIFFLPLQCLFQNKIKSKKKTKLQTAISEQSLAPYLRCNVQVKKRQIMASINNTCMKATIQFTDSCS